MNSIEDANHFDDVLVDSPLNRSDHAGHLFSYEKSHVCIVPKRHSTKLDSVLNETAADSL